MKHILPLLSLTLLSFNVFAEEQYPLLKEGRWEMSMKYEKAPAGMPPGMLNEMKMTQCVDVASQKNLIASSQNNSYCDKPVISKNGATYLTDMKCKNGTGNMSMHAETTFDGDTAISSRVVMKGDNLPEMVMLTRGKYLGACPEGMKAGDTSMIGPDGKEIKIAPPKK